MTLQEITERDIAVSASKLVKITGYSRIDIKAIQPPFVRKKIRPSDFWAYVHKLQRQRQHNKPDKEQKAVSDIQQLAARIMA